MEKKISTHGVRDDWKKKRVNKLYSLKICNNLKD